MMPRIVTNGLVPSGTKAARVSELYNQGIKSPEEIARRLDIKVESARSGIKRGRQAGLIGPALPRASRPAATPPPAAPWRPPVKLEEEDVVIRAVRAWMAGTPEDGLKILSEEIARCQKRLAAMESAQKMIRDGSPPA